MEGAYLQILTELSLTTFHGLKRTHTHTKRKPAVTNLFTLLYITWIRFPRFEFSVGLKYIYWLLN